MMQWVFGQNTFLLYVDFVGKIEMVSLIFRAVVAGGGMIWIGCERVGEGDEGSRV